MLKKVIAASSVPVSLAEFKAASRLVDDDQDVPAQLMLDAAIEYVAEHTGLALASATYLLERYSWWTYCLEIPIAPVRDIAEVSYLDVDEAELIVDPANYRWARTRDGAHLWFVDGYSLPVVALNRADAVRVTIDAGFDDPALSGSGDDPELTLPARAKHAIILLAAHWFEHREAVDVVPMHRTPLAMESLLGQLRVYR